MAFFILPVSELIDYSLHFPYHPDLKISTCDSFEIAVLKMEAY